MRIKTYSIDECQSRYDNLDEDSFDGLSYKEKQDQSIDSKFRAKEQDEERYRLENDGEAAECVVAFLLSIVSGEESDELTQLLYDFVQSGIDAPFEDRHKPWPMLVRAAIDREIKNYPNGY